MSRNYRKEYDNYHSKPEQKIRRAARNAARARFKDADPNKDVHHKDNNPLNNDRNNLSLVTQHYNRREPRLRKEGTLVVPNVAMVDKAISEKFEELLRKADFNKKQKLAKAVGIKVTMRGTHRVSVEQVEENLEENFKENDIKKSIKAPFVTTNISTLGGKDRPSLAINISLDKESTWQNKIFMNSRHATFMLHSDKQSIELIRKHYKLPKFRKGKYKSDKDVITKINKWIVSAKSVKEEVELDEWTVGDVERAMKRKYGKIDKKAIAKLKKLQHVGNVDRNDLVKVGYGKLHVTSSFDEAVSHNRLNKIQKDAAKLIRHPRPQDVPNILSALEQKILNQSSEAMSQSTRTFQLHFDKQKSAYIREIIAHSIKRAMSKAEIFFVWDAKFAKRLTGLATEDVQERTKELGQLPPPGMSHPMAKKLTSLMQQYFKTKNPSVKASLLQNINKLQYAMGLKVTEDMGTVTGTHIAGTGDDSSTVKVKKKKKKDIQIRFKLKNQKLLKKRILDNVLAIQQKI